MIMGLGPVPSRARSRARSAYAVCGSLHARHRKCTVVWMPRNAATSARLSIPTCQDDKAGPVDKTAFHTEQMLLMSCLRPRCEWQQRGERRRHRRECAPQRRDPRRSRRDAARLRRLGSGMVDRRAIPSTRCCRSQTPQLLGCGVHVAHKRMPQLLAEAGPDAHLLPDAPKAQLPEAIGADGLGACSLAAGHVELLALWVNARCV